MLNFQNCAFVTELPSTSEVMPRLFRVRGIAKHACVFVTAVWFMEVLAMEQCIDFRGCVVDHLIVRSLRKRSKVSKQQEGFCNTFACRTMTDFSTRQGSTRSHALSV